MTDHMMRLAGLEPFNVTPGTLFINVGERTNVTGSKAFARMILNGQFDEALAVLSGRTETVELLDRIRQEVGDDPAQWLPVFHAERGKVR